MSDDTDKPIPRLCTHCHYCVLEDEGYSNWTVENTVVRCALGRHPVKEGFDRFYGEDERLKFAEECASYRVGEPVEVDVDREDELTDEEQVLARAAGITL